MDTVKIDFERSCGPYCIEHSYYQDGDEKLLMGNSWNISKATKNDGRPRLVFEKIYFDLGVEFRIKIEYPWKLYHRIETLDHKMVSRMKLNPRKTWFAVTADPYPSICDDNYKNREFAAIVGFRRVPRKWVPELDKLLIRQKT